MRSNSTIIAGTVLAIIGMTMILATLTGNKLPPILGFGGGIAIAVLGMFVTLTDTRYSYYAT